MFTYYGVRSAFEANRRLAIKQNLRVWFLTFLSLTNMVDSKDRGQVSGVRNQRAEIGSGYGANGFGNSRALLIFRLKEMMTPHPLGEKYYRLG